MKFPLQIVSRIQNNPANVISVVVEVIDENEEVMAIYSAWQDADVERAFLDARTYIQTAEQLRRTHKRIRDKYEIQD
jgi:hypothetical protein